MIVMAGLAVFSGFSLNLLLQFALGTAGAAGHTVQKEEKRPLPFIQFFIIFISVLFLWLFFSHMLPSYWRRFSVYFMLFPLSALVCIGLEILGERLIPRVFPGFTGIKKTFTAITAYDGLVPASLMISFVVARNFADVFVLALFFVCGNMVAMIILNEIRRRSALERIPKLLRGSPLMLVSMGLLSLISVSVAGIFFRILEVF